MIKGWKNKPEWVRLYAERDAERRCRIVRRNMETIQYEEQRLDQEKLVRLLIASDLEHTK